MRPLLRLVGCAVFACLLLTGGCALVPDLLVNIGLDWWNWSKELRKADAESEFADELAGRRQSLDRQKHRKDQICRELIDGRFTLAEATRQFMELMELPGTTEFMRQDLRRSFPGATAEESMSRRVIEWACDLLGQGPERAEALRQRLLAELHLPRCG